MPSWTKSLSKAFRASPKTKRPCSTDCPVNTNAAPTPTSPNQAWPSNRRCRGNEVAFIPPWSRNPNEVLQFARACGEIHGANVHQAYFLLPGKSPEREVL